MEEEGRLGVEMENDWFRELIRGHLTGFKNSIEATRRKKATPNQKVEPRPADPLNQTQLEQLVNQARNGSL